MRNLWIIAKEDFINLITNPMCVFYSTLFPILMFVIIGFISKDSYGNEITSYDYYGVTILIYSILMNGMTSANAFLEERIKKPNMRIIYSPGMIRNIYLSKIFASFVFSCICHIFDMIVICMIYPIHLKSIPELIIMFVVLELLTNTLGVALCCLLKTEGMVNQIQSMVINLMAIFGGLMFSLDGFGSALHKISLISPAKWILDTSFAMIYDSNDSMFIPTVAVTLGLTLLLLFVCEKTFKKEDCIC